MTGPEVLDVARDAIYTLIVVSAPVMLVGLTVGVAISLGTLIGLIAGYAGGRIESALMGAMDIILAFPSIILAIAITTKLLSMPTSVMRLK